MRQNAFWKIAILFLLTLSWPVFQLGGFSISPLFIAVASGLSIFGAATLLSWGGELAQLEIPQSLVIAFLALVAVLPEYAVDLYFAWSAGKDPAYIHFATANMTGANRLLIGVGWATVVIAYFFKTRKGAIQLLESNRVEISALLLATLYAFTIPVTRSLSWVDSVFFLAIFVFYIRRASQTHHEKLTVEGPMELVAHWQRTPRLALTIFFFLFAGVIILLSAKPFAESLLDTGHQLGIEPFLLVQWLAPLASEAPEFIVAVLFALRLRPNAGLATLISSKVNQWTLLIGMVPLIYNLSAGHLGPMMMDARQTEEIFLTAAQSLFAIAVIGNLRFSLLEALLIFLLFATQLLVTTTEARNIYAFVYVAMAVGWFLAGRARRRLRSRSRARERERDRERLRKKTAKYSAP